MTVGAGSSEEGHMTSVAFGPRAQATKRSRDGAVFAIQATFALLSVALLALVMVKAEAALTNGEMLPVTVSVTGE
jgi:hypothetical protein